MIWYKNPLLRTILQSELKKTNQRIFEIAKQFGTESATYNKYTSSAWTTPAMKFVTTGQRFLSKGKKDPINVLKIDIRAINKMVASGDVNRMELNQILSNLAGIRITETGDVEKITNMGVKTIKQIKKATEKRIENMGEDPREFIDKENNDVYTITEKLAQFDQNFQTAYETAIARTGESTLKNNPTTAYLWNTKNGGKRSDRRLSYREMEEIMFELKNISDDAKQRSLKFEDENGGNI